MIIDSHQHFWKYSHLKHKWINDKMSLLKRDFLPPDLLVEIKKSGLDGSVAIQAVQSEEETLFLAELAGEYDFIKAVVGWIDLQSDDLPEKLDFFKKHPIIKGFRHVIQDEPDDNFILSPGFMRGVKVLRVFDYTYDILIYPHHLQNTIKFANQMPDINMVIDHIAKPEIKDGNFSNWESGIREIARNKYVSCKLSGMVTEASWGEWERDDFRKYLDIVFDSFGTGRVMFGSDWPVCLLSASYSEVLSIITSYISQFTEEEKKMILGRNAMEFYRIDIKFN